MGRKASITPEQVHAVADTIKAEGGSPTLRGVLDRLGSGSMGTVNKHLQQWKAGQVRQAAVELTLPPGLQRALLDFMAAELAATRAPLETEVAELQQTIADLTAENERQLGAIEDQAAELEAMAAEKAAAEGKAAQLAEDLASAKDDAGRAREAAEQARTELAKALLRLEAMPRLEADLAAARAELTQERAGRVSAEQQSAVLAAQKTDLEGRLVDARKEADRAKEQLQSAQARAEQLLETLADSRVSVQAGQSRIAELVAEGERQAGTILDLAKKLEALSAEKAAAEGKAGQLAEDLASAKVDAGREREAGELARTELAKALQRLEDKPGRTGKTPPKD